MEGTFLVPEKDIKLSKKVLTSVSQEIPKYLRWRK